MFHVDIFVHLLRFESNRIKARNIRNLQEVLSLLMEVYVIKLTLSDVLLHIIIFLQQSPMFQPIRNFTLLFRVN